MDNKTSPWIDKFGWQHNISKTPHLYNPSRWWFDLDCLSKHFDIPDKATYIRFVRGKTKESLYHQPKYNHSYKHLITEHRNTNKDHYIIMLAAFVQWFGKKPGWLWVEWK